MLSQAPISFALAASVLSLASGLSLPLGDSATSSNDNRTVPIWQTLPPTPRLPDPITSELTQINGVSLWLQQYNARPGVTPLVFDHIGLSSSAMFGSVISILVEAGLYVVAIDRRGHGRSTYNQADNFTYDLFAQDTFALLSAKGVPTPYNIIGWSDGAACTLAALLNTNISSSINKAFLFGAFSSYDDGNATFTDSKIFFDFVLRTADEWSALHPNQNFGDFAFKVSNLDQTLPIWTDTDLVKIDGRKVTLVTSAYEEAINQDVAPRMSRVMQGSSLITLTNVSHFAPLQDPVQFANAVKSWINWA